MQLQERAPKVVTGSPVYDLLADMARDPRVFEEYKHNRAELLECYDLTKEQKKLIMVGGEENYIKILVAERAKHFGDRCI